jgi:hypothetical protein
MLSFYRSTAFITAIAALAGCGSATPADYARMDAYHNEHAPGARGAPTPKDLAAMGYFRTPAELAAERDAAMKTADTE